MNKEEVQQNTTEQIPASIVLMEYNLNINAKEEGPKYRIPTEDEFIEAIKNSYNGHSPLTPFVDESETDIREQYNMFAAYFRKVNGDTVNAAIYVAVHITFDFDNMKKFSISITHSKLKGLEQVRVSWGNLKG